MAISRKDSFTIQVLQLTDALLVWVAFWLGGVFRVWLGLVGPDEGLLESMNWVLYIAVPFTPLVLERFGFYDRLRHKPASSAMWQLVRALVVIVLIVSIFAVFAKVMSARRLTLGLGVFFIFLLLLVRDRITHAWLKKKTASDATKERIIVAGSGVDMEDLLAELDPEITSDWKVVDHFDLGKREVHELFVGSPGTELEFAL